MKNTVRPRRSRLGQGMTEYIIMVGLVAVVTIPAVLKFKSSVQCSWDAAEGTCTGQIEAACRAEGIDYGAVTDVGQ